MGGGKRWLVWKAIELRNGCPNTDRLGFSCLDNATIEEIYEELRVGGWIRKARRLK